MSRQRRRRPHSPANPQRKQQQRQRSTSSSAPPPDIEEQDTQNNVSPRSFVIALVAVTAVLAWYFHGNSLLAMHDEVGKIMPDHRLWFGSPEIESLRDAMSKTDRSMLSGVHLAAGTLFSVFAGAAGAATVGLAGPAHRVVKRTLIWACVAFIPVSIASHIMIDQMLGSTGLALVSATAVIGVARWILLCVVAYCVLVVPVVWFVSEFRKRWNDPNYGEAS